MALPREVFKQKMAEGREKAKLHRAATLEQRKQDAMERAVAQRLAQIEAQEKAYGGYSELSTPDGKNTHLSQSQLPPVADRSNGSDGEAHHSRVPNLPRRQRDSDTEISRHYVTGVEAGTPAECQLCKGFPWTNVPINIARDRFRWLTLEFQRVGRVMTERENTFARKNGCSVCGGHPQIPDHWYATKHIIDKMTSVEYTLYACSQPCWVDWPRKFPHFFGLQPRQNPTP